MDMLTSNRSKSRVVEISAVIWWQSRKMTISIWRCYLIGIEHLKWISYIEKDYPYVEAGPRALALMGCHFGDNCRNCCIHVHNHFNSLQPTYRKINLQALNIGGSFRQFWQWTPMMLLSNKITSQNPYQFTRVFFPTSDWLAAQPLKLWVAHVPGMPGTFSRQHGLEIPTCITTRAWCTCC